MRPYSSGREAEREVTTVKELIHSDFGQSDNNETVSEEPDRKIFLKIDMAKVDNPEFHHPSLYPLIDSPKEFYSPQINDITFEMPDSPIIFGSNNKNVNSLSLSLL